MKDLLLRALRALCFIVATAIITALITGQPLSGLVKLKSIYPTFNSVFTSGRVPAWLFAIVFLIAMFATTYALKQLFRRSNNGTVHFIPDAYNTGWSRQSEDEMNARISGAFTFDGSGKVTILNAFLKGTTAIDFHADVRAPDHSGRLLPGQELWLESGNAVRAIIHLRLKPVLGEGRTRLRGVLIFRDNLNRDFSVGKVDLPYIGG